MSVRRIATATAGAALVLLAAGSTVAGAEPAPQAPAPAQPAVKACANSGTVWAPPGTAWGPEDKQGSFTGGTALGYHYMNKGNVPGPVAVQAQGLDPQTGAPTWYGLPPIGQAGTNQGTVPWQDNSMAMTGFKASSASVNGTTVGWDAC